MRLARDSIYDSGYSGSIQKLPTLNVSTNFPTPLKGSVAYSTNDNVIWFANGSIWQPVSSPGVVGITVADTTGTALPNQTQVTFADTSIRVVPVGVNDCNVYVFGGSSVFHGDLTDNTVPNSVLIGAGAKNATENGVIIGAGADATGGENTVIGSTATCSDKQCTVVGFFAQGTSASAAIGWSSQAAELAVAAGAQAVAATSGVAIGFAAVTVGANGTSVGKQSNCAADHGVSIGYLASCTGQHSVCVGAEEGGLSANAQNRSVGVGAAVQSGNDGVAVGYRASNSGSNETAVGYIATSGIGSVSIGSLSVTTQDSVAVGTNAVANTSSVAIGQGANAIGDQTVCVGQGSNSTRDRATLINGSVAEADCVCVGRGGGATQGGSTTLGTFAGSGTEHGLAIGLNANAADYVFQTNSPIAMGIKGSAFVNAVPGAADYYLIVNLYDNSSSTNLGNYRLHLTKE